MKLPHPFAAAIVALLLVACGPNVYTADSQLARNDVKGAIESLEAVRAKNPDNLDVRMRLVDAYYRQARTSLDEGDQAAYASYLAKAQDELIYSVAKWPESPRTHTWFGIIRAYEGDLDASQQSFQNALRLAKRDRQMGAGPHYFTNIAHIMVYQGKIGDARRYIDSGRKRGADISEVERIELLAAWKSGDMTEARDIFDMAGLTPGFADTWDQAPLPKKMESLEDFAAVCCSNPSCGPHMEGACRKMQQEVARRELDEETVRKQLELEMQRRRELKKIYDQRKDLEIRVEE